MRIKEGHRLEQIGEHYVITKMEGEDRRSILFALNETGAFLWNGLCRGMTQEEMIQAICAEYEALPEEEEEMRQDVEAFLKQLKGKEVLEEE